MIRVLRGRSRVVVVGAVLFGLAAGLVTPAYAAVPPTVTAVVGSAMDPTPTVDSSGLVLPVTWTIDPALPQGLSLDAGTADVLGSGVISGTPVAGTPARDYTVTATDSSLGAPIVRSSTVTIAVDGVLTSPAPVTATVGLAVTGAPTFNAVGLTAPLSFTIPAAPGWLHVSAAGALSGVPDATMNPTDLSVAVLDANGATAHATLSLAVVPPMAPSFQGVTATTGVALLPATDGFPTGATIAYTITPDVTSLTGLTFDPASGVVAGTPTRPLAPTQFLIQQVAVPSTGAQAQAVLSLAVEGVLGSTAIPITGVVGTSIVPVTPYPSSAAVAAGLTAPFTYSTVPALPGLSAASDLVINSATGAISGRPTSAVAGVEYSVVVTDKNGARARGPAKLTIAGSVLPATQTVSGAIGVAVLTRALAAGGMTAPVLYSISPALPLGLQFSSLTGVVSGIPRAQLTSTIFTVTATDSAGSTGSARMTLTIGKAQLTAPVITLVTGGSSAGSLSVAFTPPRLAPAGQTYAVEAYDALGSDLVASVETKSSPVVVVGLTPGEDYQVIVATNPTRDYDRVESLPKLGTASLETTAALTPTAIAQTASPATVSARPDAAALRRAGILLATATQALRAKRLVVTLPASRLPSKAPVVPMRAGRFMRVVVPLPHVTGPVDVRIRVGQSWIRLATVRMGAGPRLRLPAFAMRTVGRYSLLLVGSTEVPSYLTLVVAP